MRKINLYRKFKHKLFQVCVKNVSFLLIIFILGALCTFAIASNTYTGKYLMTDGKVSNTSIDNPKIYITVAADLVPSIVNEDNIKWYVSADNVRYKADIKEKHFDGEGNCNLVLQPKHNDKLKSVKKVYVIIMYGRKYLF